MLSIWVKKTAWIAPGSVMNLRFALSREIFVNDLMK
jgi:hypothetical protein